MPIAPYDSNPSRHLCEDETFSFGRAAQERLAVLPPLAKVLASPPAGCLGLTTGRAGSDDGLLGPRLTDLPL